MSAVHVMLCRARDTMHSTPTHPGAAHRGMHSRDGVRQAEVMEVVKQSVTPASTEGGTRTVKFVLNNYGASAWPMHVVPLAHDDQ